MKTNTILVLTMIVTIVLLGGCGGDDRGDSPTGPDPEPEIEPPEISSVEPDSGAAGTEVIIQGQNFNSTASENTITFNGTEASVSDAAEDQLVTEVPEGATDGPVEVTVEGETATGPDFDVFTEGSLEVIIATSGPDQDIDDYKLRLDADTANSRLATLNDTLTFDDIERGMHEVTVDSVAGNCMFAGTNPRMVDVIAADTVSTMFEITCQEINLNNKIVFASSRHHSEASSNFEIYLISSDGTGPIRLTKNAFNDRTPAISPDATQIAFGSDRNEDGVEEIYLMDADGKNVSQLTDPAMAGADGDGYPTWSPDGSQIAFLRFFDTGTSDIKSDILTINTDGTSLANLTNNAADVIDHFPDWSPDGTQIIFSRGAGDFFNNYDIYVMNIDGSDVTQVTDDPASDIMPVWSPDGSQIVFASTREHENDAETGNFELYLKEPNIVFSGELVIDLTASAGFPSWSPDGSQITFQVGSQIYRVDADGSLSSVVILTDSRGQNTELHWSPVE